MARPASKMRATYDDLVNAPEHVTAEILGGDLVLTPSPAPRHGVAVQRLLHLLIDPFVDGVGGPGGWVVFLEAEVHFTTEGLEVLVPDIAGWRRERLPALPQRTGVEVAPDWVCEVLSPGTEKRDRSIKKDIYAREKVGHLWLVHPTDHVVEAYRLAADGRYEVIGAWPVSTVPGSPARVPPFDAVALELSNLWKW